MLCELPKEIKKHYKRCHNLKRIIQETENSFEDFNRFLHSVEDIREELLHSGIEKLKTQVEKSPSILVFGQSCHAKALFVNNLLGQNILPIFSSRWRAITFVYGNVKNVRLTLGCDIEIVERLESHEKTWTTLPESDLQRHDEECLLDHSPSLEVELCHPILKDNVNVMVPPDCHMDQLLDNLSKYVDNYLPVVIYTISEDALSDSNIQEIRKLKDVLKVPFLFVYVAHTTSSCTESLTESEQHLIEVEQKQKCMKFKNVQNQLIRLGFIDDVENTKTELGKQKSLCLECSLDNLTCDKMLSDHFFIHIKDVLNHTILRLATKLSEIHNKCLRRFILSAFDMAREIQITPRRIEYAQKIEMQLYETLMKIASEQQEKIASIIQKTLTDMRSNVTKIIEDYNQNNGCRQTTSKSATMEIQQFVLQKLNTSVATEIVQSVGCLQECFTGTLQRCLESLEKSCHELEGSLSASDAVKQIVTAAYNIDLNSSASFSYLHSVMDRLRTILSTFALPWSSSNQIQCNLQWQLQVATNIIDKLSASKLARTISVQFKEQVKSSHEAFLSAIRSLDHQLSCQLEQTEEHRIAIRKRHAPRFARLALESTSLCDLLKYGMPKQIKEIGRGQYGVVSSCEPWANINPCAFKSVVPPDDRHWNDLAMEFYYTRTIPEHPRIVKLRGSVIDYSYGGGSSPAVLLIMERMIRDLYCGLRNGLPWLIRLRIAIDVTEGIRYLHSQGLVHRDIKLKNVLLDKDNRAKLTDFGFCIPEAMMSGSIVGTPVHMAPELLSGRYDSKVDVYAFGILFWYICAGKVRLPTHFDQFQNKEQLWNSVKKGIRPECLPNFNDACWYLMEQCWAADPSERPLLGYVQPQLEAIYNAAKSSCSEETLDVDIISNF